MAGTHRAPAGRARRAALALRRSAVVVVVLLLVMLGLSSLESALLYFPDRRVAGGPADLGLRAEALRLRTVDGIRLHGWWIHGRGERVLVWFYGNAGNASHRLERARRFVAELGLDVAVVDYRGYGGSEGAPGEAGLYLDGRAVYDAAVGRGFTPDRIVLFGESLGAAVAVDVAAERPAAAVILEAPFLSVRAMARAHYPLVPPFLIRSRFNNEAKIGRVAVPKLFLQAEHDEIVPPSQTRHLYALASPPKSYVVVPGASHNTIVSRGHPTVSAAWRRFLDSL